jgi:hypothetical protein
MKNIEARYFKAPIIAAIFAFPFFAAATFLIEIVERLPKPLAINQPGETIIELLAIIFGSLLFGWMIAVIPCTIGTAILANLGRTYSATRFPLFWVFVGTAAVGIPIAIAQGFTANAATPFTMLTLTGGFCAAICRRFTTWEVGPQVKPDQAPARVISPPRLEQ